MLPVGRKPTVQYVVEEMAQAGITQLLLSPGARKSLSRTTSTAILISNGVSPGQTTICAPSLTPPGA